MSNVQDFFIKPIEDFFNRSYPEAQKQEIEKRLEKLKPETLISLYDAGVEVWKRLPLLAEVIEVQKKAYTTPEFSSPRSENYRLTSAEIAQVMCGSIGLEAFRDGWWWPLYQHLCTNAKSTFIDRVAVDILKADAKSQWTDERVESAIEKNQDPKMRASFASIWEKMKERRARCYLDFAPENRHSKQTA